jgi:L-alanine-DL-glutamate epimerase-like enolase superfamily enzyme
VKLSARSRTMRLRRPLQTAYGSLSERALVEVTITDSDGVQGHGEAAPLPPYDGVSVERVEGALRRYQPILERARETSEAASGAALDGASIIDACRRADDLPQALAAIDLALWDRAGRRAGKPVAELLSADPAREVPVNATLAALDRQSAGAEASRAVAAGFRCVKVKVGVGDDAGRVAAVRAGAGEEIALRLDANGAWTVEQAVRSIEALAPAGLELVEEPTHGLRAIREVRERVSTRVAIDETAAEAGALSARVADAVCLKTSRCGGISGLLAAAVLVRTSGAEVYLGSTLDGPLGVAGAVHAAAALAAGGPLPHCGLATLDAFADLENPLPARDGMITVPVAPGLGVDPV